MHDYHREVGISNWLPLTGEYKRNVFYDVMIPKDRLTTTKENYKLDRSEVEARLYNLLRQFDFMELDKFDFDVLLKKYLNNL